MRVLAIINLSAGAVEKYGADAFGESLVETFTVHGVTADMELAESSEIEERARRALERARSKDIDAVIVGGGDGTIRTFAGVFAGTGIPIGVLPLGTLNHFAKDLGIPIDLTAAVSAIGAFQTRTVDLGEVNDAIFINNSSIGIYPYLVVDRERQRSTTDRLKWTAMALALLRAFRRFPRRRLTVKAAGTEIRYQTVCLFIGNNEYDMNFFSLGRRHHLDAGKLYVYVARPVNKWAFIWFALRAVFGDAARMTDLDRLEVSAAEITSRSSRLLVALDGEVQTMPTPLAYRSRPGALTVIAPPAPAQSLT